MQTSDVPTGFVKAYQQERINVILDPENADRRGIGYHTWQSILTVGEGGLLGSRASVEHSQSGLKFLPEPHTDFIYAVLAENAGFVGCILVLLAYMVLVSRLITGARRASDRMGMLFIMAFVGGLMGPYMRPIPVGASAAMVLAGLLPFATQPIRSAFNPPINEGEPTNWVALKSVLSREQYAKPPLTQRQAALSAQIANYWQYVTWQFGRDWSESARRSLAVLFVALGLAGGYFAGLEHRTGPEGAARGALGGDRVRLLRHQHQQRREGTRARGSDAHRRALPERRLSPRLRGRRRRV